MPDKRNGAAGHEAGQTAYFDRPPERLVLEGYRHWTRGTVLRSTEPWTQAQLLYRALLGNKVRRVSVVSAIVGLGGVALLVLSPEAALDTAGVAAGLGGAISMALGTVLTRKWQPPVSLLTFTAWQLTAGGILLVPIVLLFEPAMPVPTTANLFGLAWLGLVGAALTYVLWFRGIARIEPAAVSLLGFFSPATAVLLGWLFLGQSLAPLQVAGVLLVVGSIWLGQRAGDARRAGHTSDLANA